LKPLNKAEIPILISPGSTIKPIYKATLL